MTVILVESNMVGVIRSGFEFLSPNAALAIQVDNVLLCRAKNCQDDRRSHDSWDV